MASLKEFSTRVFILSLFPNCVDGNSEEIYWVVNMEKCHTSVASHLALLPEIMEEHQKPFQRKKNVKLAKLHIPLAETVLLSDRLNLKWMEFLQAQSSKK